MSAESCVSTFIPFSQQQHLPLRYLHHGHHPHRGPLDQMHFILTESAIKQEIEDDPSGVSSSGGEESEYSDKWQSIDTDRGKYSVGESDSSSQHSYQDKIKTSSPSSFPQVPDEDSQVNPEEGNSVQFKSTSPSFDREPDRNQSAGQSSTNFLFVGPLGKKLKYSRQRAVSNDSESRLQIVTGSPEPVDEEMDQCETHSLTTEVVSQQGNFESSSRKSSLTNSEIGVEAENSRESSIMAGGEPVSTITSTPPTQRSGASPEAGGDVAGAQQDSVSKPLPITGTPTSVIRRVTKKKQESTLPLNLSVSSPPTVNLEDESSQISSPTNPSLVRDELYFDGRPPTDRQVFVWRYRDDVSNAGPSGPTSPPLSYHSQASFGVPDVTGSKSGSGASSTGSSIVSQLNQLDKDGGATGSGSNTGGKPPKKKLKCGDCGKEFSQLRNYRYHRSRHEGSDQFSCTCPVCGKQFNDRGYLSSHMKIHRNAKEYRCEYCSKGFNQRVAYNMHRRIHTGHRPHQCEVCGKSFSRRMLLKQHMRIHTGERPYSCGVCNKAFADRSNMLLHQRLHSGERPYVCEICKKSFSKNHHLKTHMNHHAGIKPYECPKCHARFSQSSNMKTHLKKCSGIPNPTTAQRQQILRRNPLDMGVVRAPLPQLPSLPDVMAAAAAAAAAAGNPGIRKDQLPSIPGGNRLIYDQQSLNIITQSMAGNQVPTTNSPMSPARARGGQMQLENLLLSLNAGRNMQGNQMGGPPSPNSGVSLADLQLMLRSAAVAVSQATPRPNVSNSGGRVYSGSQSPPQSSMPLPIGNIPTTMNSIPGMSTFGGMVSSPSCVPTSRYSPPRNETVSLPSLSPMMSNPALGLGAYGVNRANNHLDSTVMPPHPHHQNGPGSVLRNVQGSPPSMGLPDNMMPSPNNMLRIDTRNLDGFQSLASPPDRPRHRGPQMQSPRRKQPSPTSLSSGSFIPLSTLETAAIASGLRSPSQVVRFLSSALRDAEGTMSSSSSHPNSSRLPSLQHQNVLEAMVAAVEQQNVPVTSSSPPGSSRLRQVPSPQQLQQSSHVQYQFSGDASQLLPSLHPSQHHSNIQTPHVSQMGGGSTPPYSVITSTHIVQSQASSSHQILRPAPNYSRHTSSSSSTIVTRVAEANSPVEHPQVDLHQPQHRQGYHQNLLQSRVHQGNIPTVGQYVTTADYAAFNQLRSRSHSPVMEPMRERNHDYHN